MPDRLSEHDVERIAELFSIKTSERYLQITEKLIDNKLQLHAATCKKGNCGEATRAIKAIIGVIVTIGKWCIK